MNEMAQAPLHLPGYITRSYFAQGDSFSFNLIENDPPRFYSSILTTYNQLVIHEIAAYLQSGQSSLLVSDALQVSDLASVITALELDYPELFCFQLRSYGTQNQKICRLQFTRRQKDEIFALQTRLAQQVQQITGQLSIYSAESKAMCFYEFLSRFYSTTDEKEEYNSSLCLLHKKATSLGLTRAFYFLCNEFAIPCISLCMLFRGRFQHYMNMIYLGSSWVNVDCALSQQTRKEDPTFAYFGFPDSVYSSAFQTSPHKPVSEQWRANELFCVSASTDPREMGYRIAARLKLNKHFLDVLNYAQLTAADMGKLALAGVCSSRSYGALHINIQSIDIFKFPNTPVFRVNFSSGQGKSCTFPDDIGLDYLQDKGALAGGKLDESATTSAIDGYAPEIADVKIQKQSYYEKIQDFISSGLEANTHQFTFFMTPEVYDSEQSGGVFIDLLYSVICGMRTRGALDEGTGSFRYLENTESRMVTLWL